MSWDLPSQASRRSFARAPFAGGRTPAETEILLPSAKPCGEVRIRAHGCGVERGPTEDRRQRGDRVGRCRREGADTCCDRLQPADDDGQGAAIAFALVVVDGSLERGECGVQTAILDRIARRPELAIIEQV